MNRNRLLSVFALLLVLVGVGLWYSRIAIPRATVQNQLIREADAQEILDQVRQSHSPVTLINFWASWCEPCKEEFPGILSLRHEFEGKGLKVIFVSVDDPADFEAAQAFLKEQQVQFPTFYKGHNPLSFVAQIFPKWTGSIPASVLLGPELQILDAWEGGTSKDEFEARVRQHLKGT
jgi:thiol-disulfide isomerase/thioredoxin